MGVLGHFEAKKCANFLYLFPSPSLNWSHYAKIGVYSMIFSFLKKCFHTNLILADFQEKMSVLGHFEAQKCANCLNFFPVTNSRLKCSHYENSGVYLIIFFISKKIFQYQSDFGWFLAITGVLGHFEAKKCANCLYFYPSLKFKS